MKPTPSLEISRRRFIRTAGGAATLGALAVPHVFGAEEEIDMLRIAVVGSGGRGTGAVVNALSVPNARTKLVAMADLSQMKLDRSFAALSRKFKDAPDKVDVPEERRFLGFDAYRKAMDVLRPGDIVIMATPPAFRWVHFDYAIKRGLHVFMEKPLAADGPTAKRMRELAQAADAKNLKCAVGLMVRHCRGRQELHQRIADGEIGDLIMMRAYRMHGLMGSVFTRPMPADEESEVLWQIGRFHCFLWASGGVFSDFNIHQIDEVSWMKNAWPVKALGLGGRQYRGEYVDQNFDNYSVEYTYPDGSKLFFEGRTMAGCSNDFSSTVHGSKGSAIVSTAAHTPGKVRIFRGQRQERDEMTWAFPQPEQSPYQLEWDDLIDAIIHDKPYNEVPRGVEASLVTSMGRMAAHTGQEITYEEMLNCPHEFAPGVATLTAAGPAPVEADSEGRYPVPMPGILKDAEYKMG